jgi:hypothetical protein
LLISVIVIRVRTREWASKASALDVKFISVSFIILI